MKRQYETPKAEKIEFNYTDSVVACSEWPWCWWWNQGGGNKGGNGNGGGNGNQGSSKSGGSDVSNPHWECKSPDYWGC